jgi:hypothetical protein
MSAAKPGSSGFASEGWGMRRLGGVRLFGALVAVLAVGACGDGGESGAPAGDPGLRSALEAVKQAKTVQADYTVSQVGRTLSGKADVVSGGGKLVTFTHEVTVGETGGAPVKGRLLTVDDAAFGRSTRWKLPSGRTWFAVNPRWAAKLDEPVPPEWLALVMSRLLDPAFLLDQGIAELKGVKSAPETVDGARLTKYTLELNFGYQEFGPELTAWAQQTGDGTAFSVSLWLDADHRPVRLKLDGATSLMQFDTEVTYRDYGAEVAVTAPDPKTVAKG